MQLQQLRYLIAAAECGSLRAAAQKMYISQSSLSVAIKDLEQETNTQIFNRTSRGITLTHEGVELLGYARQIVEQADLMLSRYSGKAQKGPRLSVSAQHYTFVVDAFGDFIQRYCAEDRCDFLLRETYTNEVMGDVQSGRADLGIMYLSNYNDRVITRALSANDLEFISLFVVTPHVFVSRKNPLAARESIDPEELSGLCRFEHEQGLEGSSYYSEEPLGYLPNSRRVTFSDNETLTGTLARTPNGYTIATGIFPETDDLATIPLNTDEIMNVGYIMREKTEPASLAKEFLTILSKKILENAQLVEPSSVVFDFLREAGQADR